MESIGRLVAGGNRAAMESGLKRMSSGRPMMKPSGNSQPPLARQAALDLNPNAAS
jgi:hypothetical protein